jgi:hypothetical protein
MQSRNYGTSWAALGNDHSALEKRIDELREQLRSSSAVARAEKTGALFSAIGPNRGNFYLSLWNSLVVISFPELLASDPQGKLLPTSYQGLLMYYFTQADGAPLSGRWVSYAELPGGRTYAQAVQGYSGGNLVKIFGLDIGQFETACVKAGGVPFDFGEVSFKFLALPRVPLVVTYHPGDDEFPSTCQILFDSSAENYLPIDVCAILAGMLAGSIIRANNS